MCLRLVSLQLSVLRLGFLQDGDAAVGIFPEGQKILIGGADFGGVSRMGVKRGRPNQASGAPWKVHHQSSVADESLGIRLPLRGCPYAASDKSQKFSIIQTLLPLVIPRIASSRPFGAAIAHVLQAPRWSQRGVAWPSRSTRNRVELVGD
jgi:hypothetical protein